MKYLVLTSVLLAIWAIGHLAYGAIYDAHNFSYRTKLTLTISTPSGLIEASGVRQIDATKSYFNFAQSGGNYWTRTGEALVVDLGEGRYLFAPPKGWPDLAREMSAKGIIRSSLELEHQSEIRSQVAPISVPIERMLWMATFADLTDPNSIQGVDAQDLAATFGAGYALTRVTLQVTEDPLTEGRVRQVLGWLRGYNGRLSITGANGKTVTFGDADFVSAN